MATLVVFGDTADGRIRSDDAVYATAREGGTFAIDTATTGWRVGQELTTGVYTCYEGFLAFDTSPLAHAVVGSVLLSIYVPSAGIFTSINLTLEARVKDWSTSIDTGDWVAGSALGALPLVATLDTTGLTADQYWDFTDVAFATNVIQTGTTRILVNGSRHRLATTPTTTEYLVPRSADSVGTTLDPKLTLVYTANRRAWVTGDRVRETTTTTGTGSISLAGAVTGYRAFSATPNILDDDNVAYCIVGTTEWEVGLGSWHTGNILNRDNVLASSSAEALVNFSAGTKDVFCTLPAMQGLLPLARQTQVTDVLIPSKGSTYVNDLYELATGKSLELGPGAAMEVG